uniref:protein DA1-like isoform X1 n=1 Tax=Fragaria vesca subsp. vesca TaxID=101020 RepID=UPI0005C8074D|nr:PREDICTED: protein DA1-like isoform X1 [Fragaria vesca subsp. vesca]
MELLKIVVVFITIIQNNGYFRQFFLRRIQTIEKCSRSGGDTKKVVKFVLGRAILLLFGLPDVEMGEILAHEMMHAWIHLQGVPRGCCEPSTEEGICQVMSYKWLQWFSSSGFDNSHKTNKQVQYTRELKELLVERIRCQDDEVYGQGFRDTMSY